MYKSYEQDKADRKKEELDELVKWYVWEMTCLSDPDDLKEMLQDYLHELVDNDQEARKSLENAKKNRNIRIFSGSLEMYREKEGLLTIADQPKGVITEEAIETIKWIFDNKKTLSDYRDIEKFLPETELKLLELAHQITKKALFFGS